MSVQVVPRAANHRQVRLYCPRSRRETGASKPWSQRRKCSVQHWNRKQARLEMLSVPTALIWKISDRNKISSLFSRARARTGDNTEKPPKTPNRNKQKSSSLKASSLNVLELREVLWEVVWELGSCYCFEFGWDVFGISRPCVRQPRLTLIPWSSCLIFLNAKIKGIF